MAIKRSSEDLIINTYNRKVVDFLTDRDILQTDFVIENNVRP